VCLIASDGLGAVGKVGGIEQQQALDVRANEEVVEQAVELGRLRLAASLEMRARRQLGECLGVEEVVQKIAQCGQLLLPVAAPAYDRVTALQHAARDRHRPFGRGGHLQAGDSKGRGE